ncbi:MAG: hypothetical protein JJT94_11875 [Bernardetiaceae bacterium]|nr:hypothetical protein [Bernardetiaceae bacterium]
MYWFNKFKIIIFGVFIGGIAGYLYWHQIGCDAGCAISSIWYRSSAYGMLMGGLLGSMIQDMMRKKKEQEEEF